MNEPQQLETTFVDFVDERGSPTPLNISTYTLVPAEKLRANVLDNLKRPLPRLLERIVACDGPKNGPIAIVGAGPTLRSTIERLRTFKGPILACGSVHDYLVRNGIVPTFAVVCDGGEADKGNLSLPQKETTYLIASQCDPSLFEQLQGYKVELWHYRGQMTPDLHEEAVILNGEPSIGWGGTVMLLSMCIAMLLRYQYLEFFGVDSCYEDHGLAYHCTKIAGEHEYQKMPVTVGDEFFITDLSLTEQASQFWRIVESHAPIIECTIHGKGLIAAMARNAEPGMEKYVRVVQ